LQLEAITVFVLVHLRIHQLKESQQYVVTSKKPVTTEGHAKSRIDDTEMTEAIVITDIDTSIKNV